MQALHLDQQTYQSTFDGLIQAGRISARGHVGTHLDCYTGSLPLDSYEVSAVILDCRRNMPSKEACAALPSLEGQALVLHTYNSETNRYGSDAYFKNQTFLPEGALAEILAKKPLFIIIDSHGLGPSGKIHVGIDKTCESAGCHVIENTDLSPLAGLGNARLLIKIANADPSTGKPCQVYLLDWL